MRIISAAILVMVLPSALVAKEFKFTAPSNVGQDLGKLQQELQNAGFAVKYIYCKDQACSLVLDDSETKDPASVIAAHSWPAAPVMTKWP